MAIRLTVDQVGLLSELDNNPARALAELAGVSFIKAIFAHSESNPNTARIEVSRAVYEAVDNEGERLNLKASDVIRQRAGLPPLGFGRSKPAKPEGLLPQTPKEPEAQRLQFPAPAGRIEHIWIPVNRLEIDNLRIESRDHGGSRSDTFRARMGLPPLRALERPAHGDRIAIAFAESELQAIRRVIIQEDALSGIRQDLPAFVRQLAGLDTEPATEPRPKAKRLYTDAEWAAYLDGADLPPQPAPKALPYRFFDLNAA